MKKIFFLPDYFKASLSQIKINLVSFLIFTLVSIFSGSAQTVTITVGAAKDNTIYQRNINNSNGAGEFIIAGTTGSPYFNHALMKFDIAGNIPAGAIVSNATLTLHLAGTSSNSDPYDIELHTLLQDWGEGTSNAGTQAGQGAPATATDATWVNSIQPTVSWVAGGGSYVQSSSAMTVVDGIGFYNWSSPGMVTDIQNWLNNPADNFGWLLKSDESLSFQAKKFESRQSNVIANRPVLSITYHLTPAAPVAKEATFITDNNFMANWNPVAGAGNYRLDVSASANFGTAISAPDIFISEYVEGTGNNKYIEIYNGTGANVILSGYRLRLYANGASTPTNDIALTGILAKSSAIVYKNALAAIYPAGAISNDAINYDGNDAVVLYKTSGNINVDIIGRIGENPGTAWTVGGNSTSNKTLIRKPSVISGVVTNPGAGFPTLLSEWDVLDTDDITHLGNHNFISFIPSNVGGYDNFSVNGLSQYITGLDHGITYYYRVRAFNNEGISANSNLIFVQSVCSCVGD